MSKMLLSINPEYIERIIQGKKEYEFRKVRCKAGVTHIIFYETAPVKKVVAEAQIEKILEGPINEIWEQAKECAGISYEFYQKYFTEKDKAVAYKLKNVIMFEHPKELSDYGLTSPPQSFVYIE